MGKFFLQSKVVLASVFGILLSAADQLGVVDWRAVLTTLGIPEVQSGKIVLLGSTLFLILRVLGGGLALKAQPAPGQEPDYSAAKALLFAFLVGPLLLGLGGCGFRAGDLSISTQPAPVTAAASPAAPASAAPAVIAPKPTLSQRIGGWFSKANAGIAKGSEAVAEYCTQIKMGMNGIDFVVNKPEHQRVLDEAQASLKTFCAAPPKDIPTALMTLAQIYINVEAVKAEAQP